MAHESDTPLTRIYQSLESHFGGLQISTDLFSSFGHTLNAYLAKTCEFQLLETEHCIYWKFTGFNVSKGLFLRGLKAIAVSHMTTYRTTYDPPADPMARQLDFVLTGDRMMGERAFLTSAHTSNHIFNTVLRIIAGPIVKTWAEADASFINFKNKEPPKPMHEVFGSHNASSLDEIPF